MAAYETATLKSHCSSPSDCCFTMHWKICRIGSESIFSRITYFTLRRGL